MTLIDMHLHLQPRSSCSIMTTEQLYNNLSPKFHAICITDHHVLEPIQRMPFQEIAVFFGVEYTTNEGDILAYGIHELPSRKLSASEFIEYVHQQNGVAVCAHPFSGRHFALGDEVYEYAFDAIEVNGAIHKHENDLARKAAKIMDLPMIGGSDAHSVNQLNTVGTLFKDLIRSMKDIVKCIKTKRCKSVSIQ